MLDLMGSAGWQGAEEWANAAQTIAPTLVGGSKKHGGPDLGPTRAKRAWLELLVGGRIEAVEVRRDSCVRHVPGGAAELAATVTGAEIGNVARRGKFLWWVLDGAVPAGALSAHLGMSGQFRVHVDVPEPHPHCRTRLHVNRGGEALTVDFLDQRTFGYLRCEPLVPTVDGLPGGAGAPGAYVPQSVAHIGRDLLDPHLDEAALVARLRRGTRGIKQVMLDQTVASGIGNIYADEALWLARIHPQHRANALSAPRARTLVAATQEVMRGALAQGGTSFDALYVNVNGESGYFSRHLNAYGRAGQPCGRCGEALRRESIGGRSTHWCARCQRR